MLSGIQSFELIVEKRQFLSGRGSRHFTSFSWVPGMAAVGADWRVVDGVLLRPLPYEQSESLVRVYHVGADGGRNVMSPANFRNARDESRTCESLSYYTARSSTLTGVGDPVELETGFVGPRITTPCSRTSAPSGSPLASRTRCGRSSIPAIRAD